MDDAPRLIVTEKITLQKYDGDVTQEQIDSGEVHPVETIVIEDGETKKWSHGK